MATHETINRTQVFRWPGGAKIGALAAGTQVTVQRTVDNGSSSVINNDFFPQEKDAQEIVVPTMDLRPLNPDPDPTPTPSYPYESITFRDIDGSEFIYVPKNNG